MLERQKYLNSSSAAKHLGRDILVSEACFNGRFAVPWLLRLSKFNLLKTKQEMIGFLPISIS